LTIARRQRDYVSYLWFIQGSAAPMDAVPPWSWTAVRWLVVPIL
jgi:hypothetical protein